MAATDTHETLEEHMQLQRVFRILTVDIPDKRLARKLQVDTIPTRCTNSRQRLCVQQAVEAKLAELYHGSLSNTSLDGNAHDRNPRETKRLEDIKAAYVAERNKLHGAAVAGRDVLADVLERLGMPLSPNEVDDLVWEVNDGLDGAVSWDEYNRSFLRCKHDKTYLEPTLLFHMTCFIMYDRECTGKVSMDDAMHMLFLKYGNHMEAEMEALFGKQLRDDEFVLTLTFSQAVLMGRSA
ncbi:hypothetical protein DYB32_009785 [Aphanomyces invadans]|uniref:Uncharacterized protein n=1 Tax=Aphanomyces invadans TaxID=157072 RepID=A0A418AHZ2_9STRA|nr:hypothetical protein DYB32_009785 [Aphanomyces invadans]